MWMKKDAKGREGQALADTALDRPSLGLGSFLEDRKGTVAVVFAVALPVVIAGAGYGVETAFWHYEKLKVQEMADVAAHAGAIERRAGNTSSIYSSALAAAADNGYSASSDALVVNAPPTTGAFTGGNAVEAFASRTLPRFFSNIFTDKPMVVKARSVSSYGTAGNACVLALDASAARSAYFSGSSSVTFEGCNVMANSTAGDSVYVAGASHLRTPCIMTAGGVELNSGAALTTCAAPMTGLPPVADPFKDLPEPTPPAGPCKNDSGSNLTPGVYCGGMTLKGNVNLAPGTYFVNGGTLKSNASANVTGNGVTFYLYNNAGVSLNGGANFNVSAPTTGSYSGMLFFGSRSNTSGAVTINGGATSRATGAIYFPKQSVSYLGNFSGENGCTQVVANTVSWSGNTTVSVDCTAAGMPPISVGSVVKLAE
jgi:Flp pilus assembly protein TadG